MLCYEDTENEDVIREVTKIMDNEVWRSGRIWQLLKIDNICQENVGLYTQTIRGS